VKIKEKQNCATKWCGTKSCFCWYRWARETRENRTKVFGT